MTKRVLCIVGTRPEAIKMAPVIRQFIRSGWAQTIVANTGQHKTLCESSLREFDISADINLGVMSHNQSLADLSARLFTAIDDLLGKQKPDLVIAQGDTSSVMIAALCSFYRRIPFAHVEAGLRTHDLRAPFPEELNRVVAGRVAELHFAPTVQARKNLLSEGVPSERIFVTGNTVIDALYDIVSRPVACEYPTRSDRSFILVTAHRRENFGSPLNEICDALRIIHDRYSDLELVYPVHPNPNVRDVVFSRLNGLERVHLIDPVDYPTLAMLLKACRFVLTDSGGIQEEAPALAKPVLVLREETERGEVIEAGVGRLVGTNCETIVAETARLIEDRAHFDRMAQGGSPFGDGHAAQRIVNCCAAFLGLQDHEYAEPEHVTNPPRRLAGVSCRPPLSERTQ